MEPEIRWTDIPIEVLASIVKNDFEYFNLAIVTWGHVVAYGLYFPNLSDKDCLKRVTRWSSELGPPEEHCICRITFTPAGTAWFVDSTASVPSLVLKIVTDRLEDTFHQADGLLVATMDDC